MSKIFHGITGVEILADDICVWGTSIQEHDNRVIQVLEAAEKYNLKLNKSKIQFRKTSVRYLGHIISEMGIALDKDRINAILGMERPKDKKGLQRILGIINYLGKFIVHRAEIEAPLRKLLQNDVVFLWSDEQENSWLEVKKVLTTAPVLAHYDPQKELILTTDASATGLGAELTQDRRIIAYASTLLNKWTYRKSITTKNRKN